MAPDKIVTAGHCVSSEIECLGHFWIFDYSNTESVKKSFSFTKEQMHRCTKIIEHKKDAETKVDYAVIKLDRPVTGRTPLLFRQHGKPANDATFTVIGPTKLIHADLNHEHLMLEEINNDWRITGVLDFADSMNAPVEMEFILPIISFFKGKAELQRLVWEGAEYKPQFDSAQYSNIMMALTLQNRFIAFHDWFDREIDKGAKSVEEISTSIFPPIWS